MAPNLRGVDCVLRKVCYHALRLSYGDAERPGLAQHFVLPAQHFVLPAQHFVLPAQHFVLPAQRKSLEARFLLKTAIPGLAILAQAHRSKRADTRRKPTSTVCFTAVRLLNRELLS